MSEKLPERPDTDKILADLQIKIEDLKNRVNELDQYIRVHNGDVSIDDSLTQLLNNSKTELALLESD